MDFTNIKNIQNIENKILELLKSEYPQSIDTLWVAVDTVSITYVEEATVSMTIKYGLDLEKSQEVELFITSDNLDRYVMLYCADINNLKSTLNEIRTMSNKLLEIRIKSLLHNLEEEFTSGGSKINEFSM